MKDNKLRKTDNRRMWRAIVILFAFGALAIGAMAAYSSLRGIWLEQCVITDPAEQIVIDGGKMIKADVIRSEFGLVKGANLAEIDFAAERTRILAKIPNLRDLRIRRRLPARVEIMIEERVPAVRLTVKGEKAWSGRVADADGFVFVCRRATQALPLLREAKSPGTQPGQRLADISMAALRLLEMCAEDEFQSIGVIEVNAMKAEYLEMIINGYSTVKIAWEGMADPDGHDANALRRRLGNLGKAMRSRIGDDAVVWNATQPDLIYADTQRETP